jgi:hypothetical protein
MRETFKFWTPRAADAEKVDLVNEICREYARQGYTLTLRQVHYQMVARGNENTYRAYKNLGTLIDKGRLAGLIDWSHIEDRTRAAYGTDGHSTSPEDSISAAAGGYTLPRWTDQPWHVEIWVEKEALAEVVERAASELNCTYFACRGYVSQSEMYKAGQRFDYYARMGKRCLVLHLGDHDPSGMDMTRDIRDRLDMFARGRGPEVRRIALNMDQIEQYSPPPNFAKQTDSRFAEYEAEFGEDSWELDALEPQVLHDLIVTDVREVIDEDAWDAVGEQETRDRETLQEISDRYDDVTDFLAESR